jgi:YfiH family protein
MKIKMYLNRENLLAGVTLRDRTEPEDNNMAIHTCINPENIIANRKKLASYLNCDLKDFVCPDQTHSSNFYKVTIKDKGRGIYSSEDAIKNTDAIYTYEPNILLCCFTADCVPVFFYNKETGLVGIIHSGWKGTVNEITLKVLEHIKKNEQTNPNGLYVNIGMSISQERFEVDEDVYNQFIKLGYADSFIYYNEKTNKHHIENKRIVEKQCELAGVPRDNISIDDTCTFSSPDCFSYRQNKNCGRHLNFIMKTQ